MKKTVKQLREDFRTHKKNAAKRGISFELTFEEWLKIWNDSGHIDERGVHNHQYHMARNGPDIGPYAVGNVTIKLALENQQEQKKRIGSLNHFFGKHHSEETKQKSREINLGRTLSDEIKEKIRISHLGEKNPFFGKHHSEETKQKNREMNLGKHHSEESKRKDSESHLGKHYEKLKEAMQPILSQRNGLQLTCPYCCKIGKGPAMYQWHFDNCRFKP